MYKAEEELGENADYLFPEIDNLDFEADLDKAFEEIEALHREKNDDESLEKAVSTEDIANAKRRGLVPKSGDWGKPGRWVLPKDADVPVDVGEKPRKKATLSHSILEAMGETNWKPILSRFDEIVKSVIPLSKGWETLSEIYSTSLDNFSTEILSVDGEGAEGVESDTILTQGEFEVALEILNDEFLQVGTMVRKFSVKKGVLSVYHHSFFLEDEYQGKGIATDIMEHVEEEYEKLGVSEIKLLANAEIGGYAWARQGYDFSTKNEREEMQDAFNWHIEHMDILSVLEEDEFINQVDVFTHAWEFAEWNPTDESHGQHLGKEIMLGTTWNAEKKLDKKSKGYKRGKIYYALKRRENEQTS